MEELVQYGSIWGYEIGMAETMSQTIKYLSLRVKGHCQMLPYLSSLAFLSWIHYLHKNLKKTLWEPRLGTKWAMSLPNNL